MRMGLASDVFLPFFGFEPWVYLFFSSLMGVYNGLLWRNCKIALLHEVFCSRRYGMFFFFSFFLSLLNQFGIELIKSSPMLCSDA
jgi:hypothetical protein